MQDKNISKDFIKFRQHIRSLNLNVNEQYLLELLFEYHNISYGYAFPKFQHLMEAFNTTSKNRISSTIKKLEKKGLIKVERTFLNNRYYIVEIENFINGIKTTKEDKQEEPMEEITEDEQQLMELSKMTHKQARSLLQMAKNKTSKVLEYVKYTLKRGISNVYAYVRKLIKVNANISTNKTKQIPFLATCKGRNYTEQDYKEMEWKLLGWSDYDE